MGEQIDGKKKEKKKKLKLGNKSTLHWYMIDISNSYNSILGYYCYLGRPFLLHFLFNFYYWWVRILYSHYFSYVIFRWWDVLPTYLSHFPTFNSSRMSVCFVWWSSAGWRRTCFQDSRYEVFLVKLASMNDALATLSLAVDWGGWSFVMEISPKLSLPASSRER